MQPRPGYCPAGALGVPPPRPRRVGRHKRLAEPPCPPHRSTIAIGRTAPSSLSATTSRRFPPRLHLSCSSIDPARPPQDPRSRRCRPTEYRSGQRRSSPPPTILDAAGRPEQPISASTSTKNRPHVSPLASLGPRPAKSGAHRPGIWPPARSVRPQGLHCFDSTLFRVPNVRFQGPGCKGRFRVTAATSENH
jgi:hypothetical protein